jgi:predicted metal-dependent phosphotriesterase family hydrolase
MTDAMARREFLLSLAGLCLAPPKGASSLTAPEVAMTVRGAVPAQDLGMTLMHEHVMVDFIGAAQAAKDRYDPDEVFRVVLPHLSSIRRLGCRTLVECTPAYLGRDPVLLTRLSGASGIRLVTNTGYYGASDGKYLPGEAYQESAEQLAQRWTEEFEKGIEGTEVRPGIIKIGVNKGPLSAVDAKLVRAAALAHKATGLTIASHTGDGAAALEQLDILAAAGVAPGAFIWVHAQNARDAETHVKAAQRGAWIEFEGSTESAVAARAGQVKALADRGFINRTLISLDAGWYRVGEPDGGDFQSYDFFFNVLVPAFRQAGITELQLRQLTVDNPRESLTISRRLL